MECIKQVNRQILLLSEKEYKPVRNRLALSPENRLFLHCA
jgi:hypothetical protein